MALKSGGTGLDEDGSGQRETVEGVLGKSRVLEGLRESNMAGVEEESMVSPERVDMYVAEQRASHATNAPLAGN